GSLVVGFDGGHIFRQCKLATDVGIDVTVRNVMDELANGPTTFAVRSVQLRRTQAGYRVAKTLGQRGDVGNGPATALRGRGGIRSETADGVAGICHGVDLDSLKSRVPELCFTVAEEVPRLIPPTRDQRIQN